MEQEKNKSKSITDFLNLMPEKEANRKESYFINSEIENSLSFEVNGFDFFLEYCNIPIECKEKVNLILEEMDR